MKKYFGIIMMLAVIVLGCNKQTNESPSVVNAGLNLNNIDSTVAPSEDFFRFVNGKWIDKTEIPGDQGRWGSFNELRDINEEVVLNVLEEASGNGKYPEGTDQFKAATFYSIGMDSLLAEKVSSAPLNPYFEEIQKIANVKDLQNYLVVQQKRGGGAFFGFSIFPDLKKSTTNAAYLGQGGLGLPDRDYYTKTDQKSIETREKYLSYITKMLMLLGDEESKAKAQANRIMQLETQLANASMTNVERRNIPALYNKMPISALSKIVPSINWDTYFTGLGVSGLDTIIVSQPKFMAEFQKIITKTPVSIWKEYLRWNAINSASGILSHAFVKANFDFYSKELRGVQEMRPRWKRVLGATNGALGEAIGKLYVEKTFPPEAKAKAQKMVTNIKRAYVDRINGLEWMSDSTKQKALKKLDKITVKIGYPDKWRDYSGLELSSKPENTSFAQNVMNASKFQFEYQISQLNKPVDKDVWGMTPQTVNAYYNPLFNEIVFPAAILQPPFYNYEADEAVNYGGIGGVIGHEISHGFDDQGSRFDADGNLVNWWSAEDLKSFKARTGQLVAQYDEYEPLDSLHVNGAFTLGENIGDLGGINAAYYGLKKYIEENGDPGLIDGLTAEQRFFISWGTIWRIKYKDGTLRTQINTDPHSPGMYRANGPITNMPEFYEAFGVKEGDSMWKPETERVKIW